MMRHPIIWGLEVFAISAALAIVGATHWARVTESIVSDHFDSQVQEVVDRVNKRMKSYEYGLRGARGAVVAIGPGKLNRNAFQRYSQTRDIDREFPGARGIGVILRVPVASEATFVDAARLDAWPGFGIRQLAPHDQERFVIQYIEPVDRNRESVGLDIASEGNRRIAALAAMRSGQATLTAPITLVQATGGSARSFLLLLPMHNPGAPLTTEQDRELATIGWSYAPMVIDEVLADLVSEHDDITIALRDIAGTQDQVFYASTRGDAANSPRPPLRRVDIPVFGRTWQAEFRAKPSMAAKLDRLDARLIGAAGVGLAALLGLLTCVLVQSGLRARQVSAEQARRAAMVQGSNDAIIGQDVQGRIVDWNAAAERLFGHVAADVFGHPAGELLLPPDRVGEDEALRAAMLGGSTSVPFDTTRLHRDGSPVEVSLSASPLLGLDGRCIGFTTAMRDVSAARKAERSVRELNATLEDQVNERTVLLESARHDLQNILDAVPSMIGYWDRDLRNRVANRAYTEWFGIDPGDLRGRHMRDLLRGDLFERNRAHVEGALRGEPQVFEREVPLPDGSVRHSLAHYLPDVVEGTVRGFYVLVHDISEVTQGRQKLAAALRDNKALLETLDQHSIVSVAERSGRIIEVNDGFCRISGYAREELIGQNHRIVNSGHQPHEFWVDMWQSIARGQPWRGEVCNRAKDGTTYWVDSIIAPFVDENGRIEKYISIRTDITARKNAEFALSYERELMTALLDTAPDQIYFKDLESRFLRINPGLARRYGLSDPAAAIGRSDADFFTAEHAQHTKDIERRIVDTGVPVLDLEEQETWPDRQATWNMTTKMPLRDSKGQIIGTFGISRDITARKRIEAELAHTNDRFALAADAASIGVWEYDIEAGTVEWDDWMYKLYGRAREAQSVPVSLWSESLHAEDRERAQREIADAASGLREFDTDFRIVRPDGAIRHLRAAARVQRDASGRAIRMTGVNLDVTDRKQAEQELVETSTLLKNVLDSATEIGIIAVNPSGLIKVFNRGAERLLGYARDEIVGKESATHFHDRSEMRIRAEELSTRTGRSVRTGLALVDEAALGEPHDWTYVCKDGNRISVSLVVTALRDGDGQPLGYLGVAHDTSRQREIEMSLRKAVHDARRASEAKTRFLANMSHEIRTPMNAVVGLTYLLGQTSLDSQQRDSVAKLGFAAKSLLGVINDILDISKIEAGELTLENVVFDPSQVLQELRDVMSAQAQAKKIRLEVEIPADLPAALRGDSLRLNQILANLLSNGLKFTDKGCVRLTVNRQPSGPERARLRFAVTDDGVGIAPEVQARLFQPFAQADESTTRRFGGTGLGLSIVRRLADLMAGKVGVISSLGAGSEFWVEVEFGLAGVGETPSSAFAPLAPSVDGLRGVRVLIVDDSEINLEVARRMLQREGALVTTASDGQQALLLLSNAPYEIDVVLMDVHMPVLDGVEATRCIRSRPELRTLPVIALTAGVLESEQRSALAAGMNDFVGKPFDPERLVGKVRRWVGHVAADSGAVAQESADVHHPCNAGWPDIEGIDAADARHRLGNDVELFTSISRRFVSEFGKLAVPESLDTPESFTKHAAVLHKLRGVAGNLGARTLSEVAASAELACRAGDDQRGLERSIETVAQLVQLRHGLSSWLATRASPACDEQSHRGTPLDSAGWHELRLALLEQDMRAIDLFRKASPGIEACIGARSFGRAHAHVEDLQFADALAILDGAA